MAYKSSFSGMFARADEQQSDSSSGSSSSRGSYKSSFSGMFAARKKRDEEAEARRLEAEMRIEEATKEEDKKKDEANKKKNIFERAGDVARGTGNFVKDAAVDIKDTTVGTWQGLGDVARGVKAGEVMEGKTEERMKNTKEWSAYIRSLPEGDKKVWNSPEVKKKLKEFSEKNKTFDVSQETQEDLDTLQKVDSKKLAFQTAETALNVGTLGITSIPKQLAKQGAKIGIKSVIKQGFKSGGTEAVEQIIKAGGERMAKEAAQEVLEKGAKATAKRLAKTGGKAAIEGAAYGVTQTGKRDPDADLDDYLLNSAFGAGIGFGLPFAGHGAKKGLQKAVGAFKGKGNVAAKVADEIVDPNDVNAVMNRAVEEQSEKYGTTPLERLKNWVGDQINPYRALAKIDDGYAKMTGKKRHLMDPGENLEDLARRSAVSEREASSLFYKELDVPEPDGTFKKRSAADLVKKYKGDSPEGMEFNNYTNAKFDLEFRAKKPGQRIQQSFDDDQLQKFVDDYEARNPDAVADLALKKKVNDEALDYMVNSGAISKADGEVIKSSYKNAVPLERIFPDDLERVQISGKNVGSIAKQTVIQRLEGNSDIPLSNSFDTMLNRVYKAVSQGNRAKLAQKLLERQEQGLIKGSKVLVTAGNKEARKLLKEQQMLLSKGARILEKKTTISNRQMRQIASELNKLNQKGLKVSLKSGGKNRLPGFAPEALSQLATTKGKAPSARRFFKSLIEADPAELESIRRKIATREPKLAAKLDEVANYRRQIDSLNVVKKDLKEVTAEFMDDPTTGKQVISGLIDGQPYKMEVPPSLAKAVQGMDNKQIEGILKVFAIIKKPFEVTWTGVFNPVFSTMSFLVYDTPMSFINSPQGRKVFGAKAVVEGFKSLRSSSAFQKRLAAEGVRPYGGSGASAFTKLDAEAIAAQRSILSNIKYTATNPGVALSKLDVWGGKLANSTRTRIARAEYDSVLKQMKKEGIDITSEEAQKKAMASAAMAYRTIMPDYDTMSHLTRQVNSVVPFFAASTAGTRSFGQAIRRNPRATLLKAGTVGLLPTVGVTAFSLMQPAGQEFYKDMEASGQTRVLNDNLIIVLPGAHKDEKTGEWKGIVKIPLAPEFRAINQTTWKSTRAMMGGEGPSASNVALSLFDTITGGVRTSENPLISTRRILSGEDPRTGERLVKGDMANLPKEEQVYEWTSGAGKFVSKVLGTSPIQGDKLLSQFGLVGQTAKNGGKPVEAVVENIQNRFTGAFGEKASESFFNTYSPLKARRDKASREVTDLLKQGRRNEAARKAAEFNVSLRGKFADFEERYGSSPSKDPLWDEMMNGLIIKTSERAFESRLSR